MDWGAKWKSSKKLRDKAGKSGGRQARVGLAQANSAVDFLEHLAQLCAKSLWYEIG